MTQPTTTPGAGLVKARGHVDRRFAAVAEAFDGFLLADPDFGAQFAVRWHGEVVLDLWGGAGLEEESLTGVFSVGKGLAAIATGVLLQEDEIDLDAPMARYWPEFAAGGKGAVTVRQVLVHQAGVVGVPGGFSVDDLSSGSARAKVAAVAPQWRPGSLHGYHALTIGMMMEELFLRVRGEELQHWFDRTFRVGCGHDVFLGLPVEEDHRYVPIAPPILTAAQQAEVAARPPMDRDTLSVWAFNGNGPVAHTGRRGELSPDVPSIRRFGGTSHAAVASARGLAGVYASAVTGSGGAEPLLGAATVARMGQVHSHGQDFLLHQESTFGLAFMKPNSRLPFASFAAVGHDGAAGALAYADPLFGTAVGYVPYPSQHPGGADPRTFVLGRVLRDTVRELDGTEPR